MLGISLDYLKLVAESLLLSDLKLIAKSRAIKGSKNMSEKRSLSAVSKQKIDNERLKNIREDLSKYEIESKKSLSTQN